MAYRKYFLLILLFGVFSTSLLSPLASNTYLSRNELRIHSSAVVQAKIALEQGQFPLRTAPLQNSGWGNPWFQFHSPLSYTVGGLFYKWIVPDNPYMAVKLTIWLALFLASVFMYRLINWLIHNEEIALLAAAVYITAPYFLINIHARGDFTEAIAQGLLPAVLYYTMRLYFSDSFNLRYFVLVGITWCALASTCLITFVQRFPLNK